MALSDAVLRERYLQIDEISAQGDVPGSGQPLERYLKMDISRHLHSLGSGDVLVKPGTIQTAPLANDRELTSAE